MSAFAAANPASFVPAYPFAVFELPLSAMRMMANQIYDFNDRVAAATSQAAHLMAAPLSVKAAVADAVQKEWLGTAAQPVNDAITFGITETTVKGKKTPVTVRFDHVTSTCDMWQFKCPQHKNAPTVVLAAPISGSHPTVMAPLAQQLLEHNNVVVIGCPDPHNMPAKAPFDLSTQIDDVVTCLIRLNQNSSHNAVLVGTSQSGPITAAAVGIMSSDPEKYKNACPSAAVFIGSPMDTRLGPTPMNYLARLNDVSNDLLVHVANAPHNRALLPHGVMRALYGCTSDKIRHGVRPQDIDADHAIQMHDKIFRDNLLAEGRFPHRGKLITLKNFHGFLATIGGTDDGIVPAIQTHAARNIFSGVSKDRHFPLSIKGAGHYDTIQEGPPMQRTAEHIVALSQRVAALAL